MRLLFTRSVQQSWCQIGASGREFLEPLAACLLGGAGAASIDDVRPQAVQEMMEDRTASHILEVPLLRKRPPLCWHALYAAG